MELQISEIFRWKKFIHNINKIGKDPEENSGIGWKIDANFAESRL